MVSDEFKHLFTAYWATWLSLLWGADVFLNECALLTWAQPCLWPQCPRPLVVAKPSPFPVQMLMNNCPLTQTDVCKEYQMQHPHPSGILTLCTELPTATASSSLITTTWDCSYRNLLRRPSTKISSSLSPLLVGAELAECLDCCWCTCIRTQNPPHPSFSVCVSFLHFLSPQ